MDRWDWDLRYMPPRRERGGKTTPERTYGCPLCGGARVYARHGRYRARPATHRRGRWAPGQQVTVAIRVHRRCPRCAEWRTAWNAWTSRHYTGRDPLAPLHAIPMKRAADTRADRAARAARHRERQNKSRR